MVCSPGGIENLDAAGHGRLSGDGVDLGAFELGAGSPTGVAEVGTSAANSLSGTAGDDILCGMGGGDTLKGNGGADWIDGGTGTDHYRSDQGDTVTHAEVRSNCTV